MKSRPKYRLLWLDPESGSWEVYQSGLSCARADRLSLSVTYFLSVRWFGHNVPTRVEVDD